MPSRYVLAHEVSHLRNGNTWVTAMAVMATAGFEQADTVFSRLYIQDQALAPDAEAAARVYYGSDAPAIAVQRGGIMGFNTPNEITNIAIKGPKT